MISFIVGVTVLVLGYLLYGKFVEKVFGTDPARPTPVVGGSYDGVDYVALDWKKALLIQFLNITGTGPIFGAIAGALWGPWAFIWIVLGCVFAGATHDYLSGMLSLRNNGASIPEIIGKYLGPGALYFIRTLSLLLLVLIGAVFITSPALILENLIDPGNKAIYYCLLATIVTYYILATMLPIDKFIGRVYPIFGAALLIMGAGIFVTLFTSGEIRNVPEFDFTNLHPKGAMLFPALFITIACGAISGFHATQSPMMARCLKNEGEGRKVFYGAMILEGLVAMIWAAAAMAHFGGQEGLAAAGAAPVVVNKVALGLMGAIGGALAVLGVVACPITSGDTAFRSARLMIADMLRFDQKPFRNRLLIAVPLFAVGVALCFMDFDILWRYFAWANQTLATFALWAGAAYLAKYGRNYWIALIPAVFMTSVVVSFICIVGIGFGLPYSIGIALGFIAAVLGFAWFFWAHVNRPENHT
ncbi:MAG: carbon starvation protein A [Candidatus Accumulibacter sp.]|jgi:carbon starvation protein CstA|nr:carbon starvation protein A [Accumulibacter sp.]